MFKPRATMAVIVLALAASLGLSACSMNGMDMGGNTSTPSESLDSVAPFNDQDVNFAMQMVQHHEQAIEMAQLILDKDGIDRRVTELAQNIKDAQGPEIEEMNSWLIGWGGESTSMDGMDMGGDTMSADDMAALESATGVEASRLFLEQMTCTTTVQSRWPKSNWRPERMLQRSPWRRQSSTPRRRKLLC